MISKSNQLIKKNKNIFSIACLVLLAFACSNDEELDPCMNVVCLNDGICVDGSCDCPYWQVGPTCEGESRTKFYGTFIGPWRTGATPEVLKIVLTKDESDVKRILWDDIFYLNVTGTITAKIPEQHVYNEDSTAFFKFKGEGSVSKLILTLDIYLDYGDGYFHTSYEGIRQE